MATHQISAQARGIVVVLVGKAWVINKQGTYIALKPGDVVQEGQTVVTETNSRLELALPNGQVINVAKGRELLVDANLLGTSPVDSTDAALKDLNEAIAKVTKVIQSGGDVSKAIDAPAAGVSGGDSNELHNFFRVSRISEALSPLGIDREPFHTQTPSNKVLTPFVDANPAIISVNSPQNSSDTTPDITGKTNLAPGSVLTLLITDSANQKQTITTIVKPDGTYTATPKIPLADGGFTTKVTGTSSTGKPVTAIDPGSVITDHGSTNPPDLKPTVTVNYLPIATPTAPVGDEDTPIPVVLKGTDVDGTVVSVTVTKLPPATEGVLTKSDGTPVVAGTPMTPDEAAKLVFTPAPNFNGKVNVPFTVTDNSGATSPEVTVPITVNPVNDPPVATPTAPVGDEDKPIPVVLKGTDVDGTVVSVTVTKLPPATEGVLTKSDGTPVVAGTPMTPDEAAKLVFTPAPNFNGKVNMPFTVTDNSGATSPEVTVPITVNPVNDPPVATPTAPVGDEDKPIPVVLKGTDVDGTVVSVTVTKLPPATEGVLTKSDGTPVVAGTPMTPDEAAKLVFTPAPNFNGKVNVPFTVTDNSGATSPEVTVPITVNPVNDPPVATPTAPVGDEDTPIPVVLKGTDVDGTVVSVTVTKLPPATEGVLTKSDGTPVVAGTPMTPDEAAKLVFTPAPNFNGKVNVPFTVTDNSGATSPEVTVPITVNPVNDPPVATPTAPVGDEDTPIPVVLKGTDVDGTVVSVTVTKLPPATEGVLTKSDGTPVVAGTPMTPDEAAKLVFTPAPNFNGKVNVPFTVTDNSGATSPEVTVPITVNPVNDPPVATPTAPVGDEDTPIPVVLKGTDVDGTVVSVTVTKLPPATEGVLTKSDGTPVVAGTPMTPDEAAKLVFTPAPNFNGKVNVPFTVTDNSGATSPEVTVPITVNPVNDPPVATPTAPVGDEDTPIPVVLKGTDVDGTVVSVTVTKLPPATEGVLTKSDGTPVVAGTPMTPDEAAKLVFTPAPNFNGKVNVPFTVTDNSGATSPEVTVPITVNPVNDPPVATPTAPVGDEDTPIPVVLKGTDVDGTVVSVTVTKLPPATEGVLTKSDGTPVVAGTPMTPDEAAKLVFTPAPNFNGKVNVPFTVTDNSGATSPEVTVPITVNPVNDPPVATPTAPVGDEDTPIPVVLKGTDVDGTVVSVTVTKLPPATEGVLTKSDGTPVVAGTPMTPDEAAKLVFTPAPNFNGKVNVPFTVTDNSGATSPEVTVPITVNPVNDPPVATPTAPVGDEDTPIPVVLKGTDVDGTVVSVTVTKLPPATEGVLTKSDGTPVVAGTPMTPDEAAKLVFTPAPNFNGKVNVPFTVTDNSGATSPEVTVPITVNPVNDPPVATPTAPVGDEDTPIPVVLKGTDVDGTVVSVTVTKLPPATEGVLTKSDGTPVVAGTPMTPDEAAKLVFTPAPNFNGKVNVPFTVTDNSGATSPEVTVPITVNPVNDPPVATPTAPVGDEDTPIPVVLKGTDVDGTVVSVTVTKLPPATEGVLTKSDGTPVVAGTPMTPDEAAKLVFTPAPNFNGKVNVPFTVTDNSGATSPEVTVPITVNPVNDPPVATPTAPVGDEDTPIPVVLKGTDVDGTVVSVTVTKLPPATEGVLTKSDGTPVVAGTPMTPDEAAKLVFTPAPNFNGKVNVPFTVTDNSGATSPEVTVPITVNPVNDPPVATPTAPVGDEDTPIPVVLKGTDVDGTVVSVTVTKLPPATEGVLTKSDGTPVVAGTPMTPDEAAKLVFTPAPNFNGKVNVPFTVTDNSGATSPEVTVPITVNPVNDPPVATPTAPVGDEDTPIPVVLKGTDVDGTVVSVTVTKLPPATEGVLTKSDGTPVVAGTPMTPDEAAKLVFTPAPNFNGKVNVPFTVTDNSGATSPEVTVPITVNPVNDPPVAVNDGPIAVTEDTPVKGNVLGNDYDPDKNPLTVTQFSVVGVPGTFAPGSTVTIPGVGTLSIAPNGDYTFTPALNYNGPVPVTTYTISDGLGGTATATLTFAPVTAVKDGFTDVSEENSTDEDTAINGNVLTGTSSVDGPVAVMSFKVAGDTVAYTAGQSVSIAGVGILTIKTNGDYTFTPLADYNGPVPVVTYTLSDGTSTINSTLTLNVKPIADILADDITTKEDTAVNIKVNVNDSFENVDHHITAINGIAIAVGGSVTIPNGVVTLKADGTLDFMPATNFNGAVPAFSYTVTSGGMTETADVKVTVSPINDAPHGADSAITTYEDTDIVLTVSNFGFTDPNDTPANSFSRVEITTLPTNGTLLLNGAAVSAGQFITASDIASGLLVFHPALNAPVGSATGANYTNLTFQVEDNGGTANGGINLDPTPHTLNINVTPVADAPLLTVAPTYETQRITFNWVASDAGFNNTWGIKINGGAFIPLTSSDVTSGTQVASANTLTHSGFYDVPVGATITYWMAPNGQTSGTLWDGTTAALLSATPKEHDGTTTDTFTTTELHFGTPIGTTINGLPAANYAVRQWWDDGAYGNTDFNDLIVDVKVEYRGALNVTPALVDTDGSEKLGNTTVHFIDPDYQILINNAGIYTPATKNAAGDYDLTATQLTGAKWSVLTGAAAPGIPDMVVTAHSIEIANGSTSTAVRGSSTNDTLTGGTADDRIQGGAGNDTLTGGTGSDTFIWTLADQGTVTTPAIDRITDFNTAAKAAGGDVLDLRDILPTATTAATLDTYLDFRHVGSDTVIDIHPTGSGGGITQRIVLTGIDLSNNGSLGSDQAIIQDLLNKGKLISD